MWWLFLAFALYVLYEYFYTTLALGDDSESSDAEASATTETIEQVNSYNLPSDWD